MAFTVTLLDHASADGATSLATASLSPSSGSLLVAIAGHRTGVTRTVSSLTSGFTTGGWTEQLNVSPSQSGADCGLAIYTADFTSGTGTVTAEWSGNTSKSWVAVVEVSGHSASPISQTDWDENNGASNTATPSVTLTTSPASDSLLIGSIVAARNNTGATPGTDWTELSDELAPGFLDDIHQIQYWENPTDGVCDWSGLSSASDSNQIFAVMEIAAAAVASRRIFIIS